MIFCYHRVFAHSTQTHTHTPLVSVSKFMRYDLNNIFDVINHLNELGVRWVFNLFEWPFGGRLSQSIIEF